MFFKQISTTDVAKLVSKAWKALDKEEREKWEETARKDKARYEMEKLIYKGPWKVPVTSKKNKLYKDPLAPKRPQSAFLSFSNSNRFKIKSENKNSTNAEISRLLATLWKETCPHEEKKVYIDAEFKLRQEYKVAMCEWKRHKQNEFDTSRDQREHEAMILVHHEEALATGALGGVPLPAPSSHSSSSRSRTVSFHHHNKEENALASSSGTGATGGTTKYGSDTTATTAGSTANSYAPPQPHPLSSYSYSQQVQSVLSSSSRDQQQPGDPHYAAYNTSSSNDADYYKYYQQEQHPPSTSSSSAYYNSHDPHHPHHHQQVHPYSSGGDTHYSNNYAYYQASHAQAAAAHAYHHQSSSASSTAANAAATAYNSNGSTNASNNNDNDNTTAAAAATHDNNYYRYQSQSQSYQHQPQPQSSQPYGYEPISLSSSYYHNPHGTLR